MDNVKIVDGCVNYYDSDWPTKPFLIVKCHDISTGRSFNCVFGDNDFKHLEINITDIGGYVRYITCYGCDTLFETVLEFPDSKELVDGVSVGYFPKSFELNDLENCGQFQMSFNSKELDIVILDTFKKIEEAKKIDDEMIWITYRKTTKGRVEYVEGIIEHIDYDNENLLYIRIKDLTPEEYAILKKYKSDRPIEDFVPIAYLPNND